MFFVFVAASQVRFELPSLRSTFCTPDAIGACGRSAADQLPEEFSSDPARCLVYLCHIHIVMLGTSEIVFHLPTVPLFLFASMIVCVGCVAQGVRVHVWRE